MPRAVINNDSIRALRPGEVISDAKVDGFVARRLSSTLVWYCFRYRAAGGGQRWCPIGTHRFTGKGIVGGLSASDARQKAKTLASHVAKGRDPIAEREARIEAERRRSRLEQIPVPPCPGGENGIIYFVHAVDVGLIKIGFTRDLNTRLRDLRVTSPAALTLVAYELGAPDRERELHRAFAGDRVRGEWFRLTDRIRAEIERLRLDFTEPADVQAPKTKGRQVDLMPDEDEAIERADAQLDLE